MIQYSNNNIKKFMDNSLDAKFFKAILNKKFNTAIKLIKAGADVNYHDKYGSTVLYHFVFEGNISVVNMLISNGASIDVYDNSDRGLLHQVIRHYNYKMIKHLLNLGINVNC